MKHQNKYAVLASLALSSLFLLNGCGSTSQRTASARASSGAGEQVSVNSLDLSAIAGKQWNLVSGTRKYNTSTASAFVLGSKKAFVQFDAAGQMSGFSGCNSFSGSLNPVVQSATDLRLEVRDLRTTLMFCSDSPEDLFYDFLSKPFTMEIAGSSVRLTGVVRGDPAQLVFELPPVAPTPGLIFPREVNSDIRPISLGREWIQVQDPRLNLPVPSLNPMPLPSPLPFPR